MAYVALLRGINVPGKSPVGMTRLKATFEQLGLRNVRTYINSGNVVFTTRATDRARLRRRIERAITAEFDLDVTVVLRDTAELGRVLAALPRAWRNDTDHRCEVFFSDEFTSRSSVDLLPLTPGVEQVRHVPGAILCRIPRDKQRKSKLTRLVGTDLYKTMTSRSCNTARRLYELLLAADA